MAFTFFIRLTACLVAVVLLIVAAETSVSLRSKANVARHAEKSCVWDCKVVDSKFGLEMKTLISEFRLITVQLNYEHQEDKKCLNQRNLQNSTIKPAEIWTWLTGEIPSHGGQNVTQYSFNVSESNSWFRKSLEGQVEVGVSCSLKPAPDSNDTKPSVNDAIAMVLMKEVAKCVELPHSQTAFCYKLSVKNGSYVCVNQTTVTDIAHNVSPVTWRKQVFRIIIVVIFILSIWYSVFVLCLYLFTPTEFKDKETRRDILILRGSSPESISSWIPNKLSSFHDWKKWKRFLFVFLFFLSSVGFLIFEGIVIDVYLPLPGLLNEIDTGSLRAVVISVSVILIFILLFARYLSVSIFKKTSCVICRVYGGKEDIFHDKKHPEYYGIKEMKMHLLIQPFIVKRCLTQVVTLAAHLCPFSFVKWLLVLLLLPLWFPIYLLYVTLLFLYSSPFLTCVSVVTIQSDFGQLETTFIMLGYLYFALAIASYLVTIIRGCLMHLPNYLPFASLGLVTIYYLWKVYAPYPRKYHVLAFKLYDHYTTEKEKQGCRGKLASSKSKPVCYTQDCLRMIPKDLYDDACSKLMPIQESRSELAIAFFVILIFIFFVTVVITEESRVDDETKALGTLFTMLLPKISEMLFGENPEMKKANEDDFDKRVASVVKEYLSSTCTQQRKSNIGNGGGEITIKTKHGNSDGDASARNKRRQHRRKSPNERTPLLSSQYGSFDHSD